MPGISLCIIKKPIVESAVLVIDVQCGLFDEYPRPYEADDVVQRINNVTRLARDAEIPVIIIQGETAGFLEYGSERWKLQPELTVDDSDLKVRKATSNCMLSTDLAEKLNSIGATNLVICGYASEFCIDSTTRGAAQLGYTIQLVSDAHTTHDKKHLSAKQIREHHNITLSMGPTIAAVQSADINFGS